MTQEERETIYSALMYLAQSIEFGNVTDVQLSIQEMASSLINPTPINNVTERK